MKHCILQELFQCRQEQYQKNYDQRMFANKTACTVTKQLKKIDKLNNKTLK